MGSARSRIGICYLRRGDVGGKAPTLQEKVKMQVERWEKILGWVMQGGESESDVCVGLPLELKRHRLKKKLKWW